MDMYGESDDGSFTDLAMTQLPADQTAFENPVYIAEPDASIDAHSDANP